MPSIDYLYLGFKCIGSQSPHFRVLFNALCCFCITVLIINQNQYLMSSFLSYTKKSALFIRNYLAVCAVFSFAIILSCNTGKSPDAVSENTPAAVTAAAGAVPVTDTIVATVGRLTLQGSNYQVLFDQRQSFFSLLFSNKNFSTILSALQQSLKSQTSVRVSTDNKTNTILNVLPISAEMLDSLANAAKNNITATGLKMLAQMDSVSINRVAPRVGTAVGCIGSMTLATATNLFTIVASQSCTRVAPPYACIPFQYVRDGCYARAHSMAATIASYNYCVNKVFSFANQGTDQLAVRAAMWGNCCVTWWYHVAPVVVVQTSTGLMNYVIDPGMFTAPVPLNTWLGAQANTGCTATARVSSYIITGPGAYQPANYAGTLFNSDPYYINTNQTLAYYRYFTTCP